MISLSKTNQTENKMIKFTQSSSFFAIFLILFFGFFASLVASMSAPTTTLAVATFAVTFGVFIYSATKVVMQYIVDNK